MSALRPDQRITDSKGKTTCWARYRTIDNLASALKASIADEESGKRERKLSSAKLDSRDDPWCGTETPEEYVTMLREGWAHGVTGVEGLEGLSTDEAEDMTFQHSVCGTYLDCGAYQNGDPECMLEFLPEPSDAVRGLTLVIDSCFAGSVRAGDILDYARSVMQLVAWLQAQHVETSIYAVVPILMGRKRLIYIIPIRETGDILMPERVAAILHPAFLRRGWFAMVEQEYYKHGMQECRVCQAGMGNVTHATADELRQVLPEAYSVIMLPKVGSGDPMRAVKESITLKLRRE